MSFLYEEEGIMEEGIMEEAIMEESSFLDEEGDIINIVETPHSLPNPNEKDMIDTTRVVMKEEIREVILVLTFLVPKVIRILTLLVTKEIVLILTLLVTSETEIVLVLIESPKYNEIRRQRISGKS